MRSVGEGLCFDSIVNMDETMVQLKEGRSLNNKYKQPACLVRSHSLTQVIHYLCLCKVLFKTTKLLPYYSVCGKIQGDGQKFLDRFKSYFGSQISSQSLNESHIC